MTHFAVHTVPGSPFGRAVMAMLAEKHADWRIAPLAPGALRSAEHLARQPFAKMPALEWGGRVLYETQAILRYLDALLPGPCFTPGDLDERARMDQLLGISDWYLFQQAGRIVVFQRVIGPMVMGLEPDLAAITAAMPISHVVFAELSRLLGDQPWFGGAEPSLADLMIGPQCELFARAPEWAELTADRPNLTAWLDRIEARPSMVLTKMENLPALIARQAA